MSNRMELLEWIDVCDNIYYTEMLCDAMRAINHHAKTNCVQLTFDLNVNRTKIGPNVK